MLTKWHCLGMEDSGNHPATKNDIRELKERIDRQFADLDNKFATKEDLKRFATKEDLKRFATKDDLDSLESRMDTKLDTLADMIAALGTKMDDFQKERIHRDEFQDLENRMKRVEKHTGLIPT